MEIFGGVIILLIPFVLIGPAIVGAVRPEKFLPGWANKGRVYGFFYGLGAGYIVVCFLSAFVMGQDLPPIESVKTIVLNLAMVCGILSIILIPQRKWKFIYFTASAVVIVAAMALF